MNIAINGFGRIGRTFLRALLQDEKASNKVNVVAINIGPASIDSIGHMLKYDTLMGAFPGDMKIENTMLYINHHAIQLIAEKDPARINWGTYGVVWVLESSGRFTHYDQAVQHVHAGAQKVLITAPAQGVDVTIIPGVNDAAYDDTAHTIVSLGSCTTNALLPMIKVLHDAFTLTSGFMTTIHAYTNTQVLLDVECSDLRRARAAALNIIPTTTGATKLVDIVIPSLKNKINGCAMRVPVAKGSLVDFAFTANKPFTAEAINQTFKYAQEHGPLSRYLTVTDDPIVSSDICGNPHSVIIDSLLTSTVGHLGKVFGWYDNEWGYSQRIKDFLMTRS